MKSSNLLFYKIYNNFYGKQLTTKRDVREHYLSFLSEIFGTYPNPDKRLVNASKFYIDKLERVPRLTREKVLQLSKSFGLTYKQLYNFKKTIGGHTTRSDYKIFDHFDAIGDFIEARFWSELEILLRSKE